MKALLLSAAVLLLTVMRWVDSATGEGSSAVRTSQGVKHVDNDCPPFAQTVLCQEEAFVGHRHEAQNNTALMKQLRSMWRQTLLHRHRGYHPECPLACQRCEMPLPGMEPREKFDDKEVKLVVDDQPIDHYGGIYCHDDKLHSHNVWQPGDMDRMYQSIVHNFTEYSPTILSAPHTTGGPWIVQLEDFLTPQECQVMVDETVLAIYNNQDGTDEWVGIAQDAGDELGGECVSTQAWCSHDCMRRPALQSVKAKIQRLVGMPWKYAEDLHLIEYVPGQRYGNHHDFIDEEVELLHGPRLFTILFYLNQPVGGGKTCFPELDSPLCVQPKVGRAIIWPQVLNDNPTAKDNRTWHEAYGVTAGYKYSSTVWYHLRDYERAEKMDCVHTSEDLLDDLEDDEEEEVYVEDPDDEEEEDEEEEEEEDDDDDDDDED